ncbi:type II toxin-antitoxin system RelE/ParE family toxin [Desulfococcaceae bacterium HSG9]|nr:type II toxin-antitoxin system RelE/ParE family toxin [Desulfococcaceae bacterium HSG9]
MIQKKNKLIWIGNSLRDLKAFPKAVRERFGYALYIAESGGKHNHAKPLKGFKGSGVLEIVENFDKGTYRSVYTVKFKKYVYVLHCFEKKSKKGIAPPKPDIEMIRVRLKIALRDYQNRKGLK